jgi:hypothetical protein
MQSLTLDVNVVSEEGTGTDLGEEDDDLLRAAEELGIDLTAGLRRQQAEAGELEAAGVASSALQDVIGAGNEPAEKAEAEADTEAPSAPSAAEELLAAAAALSGESPEAAGGETAPALDDILDTDTDAADATSGDSDED